MKIPDFSRREIVAGLGLLGIAGARANAAIPPPATAAPATTAAHIGDSKSSIGLERFLRMRCSPDGSPVMWLYHGVLMGKPDGQLARPLVGMGGMSFTHAVRRAPGVYDWQLDEVGYYLDLHSGEVLSEWLNPYTNKRVKPAHYRSPENLQYSGAGITARDAVPGGAEFRGEITTLAEVGGVVTMTEDLYVRIPGSPAAGGTTADRVMASLGTFTANAKDLAAPASRWVDCQMAYATMNSFARWLGMEAMPGVQNMRLAGAKRPASEIAAVPTWLRARIDADHPTFWEVPKKWTV